MKLAYVEVEGFRGFRQSLRIDFGSDFTILTGRNGVGKSSILDAIEFALTGAIDKYRVETVGRETFDSYIWWVGDGAPERRRVELGLWVDGEVRSVTREIVGSKEIFSGDDVLRAAGLSISSQSATAAVKGFLIRDEWISGHSLDLTELERYQFVSAALGTVDFSVYLERCKALKNSFGNQHEESLRAYATQRGKASALEEQMSRVKAIVNKAASSDVMTAIVEALGASAGRDVSEAATILRREVPVIRERLEAAKRALEIDRQLTSLRDQFGQRDVEADLRAMNAHREQLLRSIADLNSKIAEAQSTISRWAGGDPQHENIALLARAGEELGLQEGHCPLCRSEVNATAFMNAIKEIKREITARQTEAALAHTTLATLRAELAKVSEDERTLTVQRLSLENQWRSMSTLRDEHAAALKKIFGSAVQGDQRSVAPLVDQLTISLDRYERAILHIDASQATSQLQSLEAQLTAVRVDMEVAQRRVSRLEKLLGAVDEDRKTILRTAHDAIEQRLSSMTPLLQEFYRRLRPHAAWPSIRLDVRGDVRRFLNLSVGNDVSPQFIFSSGQRRAAGLALLLSVYLSRVDAKLRSLLLDDPIQHIDDYRALNLVECLAAIIRSDQQIICSVEDQALALAMARRLGTPSGRPGVVVGLSGTGDGVVRKAVVEVPIKRGRSLVGFISAAQA